MNKIYELLKNKKIELNISLNSSSELKTYHRKLFEKIDSIKEKSKTNSEYIDFKNKTYKNISKKTSISVEKFTKNKQTESKKLFSIEKELKRIQLKEKQEKKKDKIALKKFLTKLKGKGFNSQRLEYLLSFINKNSLDFLNTPEFLDKYRKINLHEGIEKQFINKSITDFLRIHSISIEENRVLLN